MYLYIMRLLDVHFLGENDVNLNEELVAEVEGGDGVDLFDVVVVVDCDPSQLLEELRTRSATGQNHHLLCGGNKYQRVIHND